MKNITVDEILNVIDDNGIVMGTIDRHVLRNAFTTFLEEKKGRERNESSSWGNHKRFVDEWGNSDWRDTGEMGG